MSTLLLVAVSACGLADPSQLVGCTAAYADVESVAAAELESHNVPNAALVIRVDGQVVCRLFFGSYDAETRVATASAAKWLTAAAILAVADRGGLGVATRTGELFPAAPPATANITISQLLSHTSGLLSFSRCMGRPDDTLQGCAQKVLESDLHFEPGTAFFYSGPPFTVAGAMAEKAMGQPWADLFRTVVAEPLRMSNTSYGDSPNPALSEGEVVSTADDYATFAQMILDLGFYGGQRVQSPEAIAQMRRNWSAGLTIQYSPRGEIPYGLGVWFDAVDEQGTGTVISSPGIGGFVPVLDFGRRMVFVFEAQDDIERVWPVATAILQHARAAVDAQRSDL